MLAPTPYFADRGCHVRIYEEARIPKHLGHEVCLVTYHLGRDMPEIPTERIIAIPWYRKLTAGPSWHKPYLDLLLFFKALKTARNFRPDLIHAHLHEGAFIGIFLKKFLTIPLLFDCQGSLTGELIDHGFMRPGSWLAKIFAAVERFINRNVDAIITSSTSGADALSTTWGVPAALVNPLTDGVNTVEFRPGDRVAAKHTLGLPSDRPVIVFLGLLNTFTGRVDYRQASYYLAAGDLAVSPKISLTEANGKLFNYMACGLPCLVFDTPVNREILGETGTYANFADPVDFADRLTEMIADPLGLEHQGECARQKALQEHSWQARGEMLVQLYCNLAGKCS